MKGFFPDLKVSEIMLYLKPQNQWENPDVVWGKAYIFVNVFFFLEVVFVVVIPILLNLNVGDQKVL